MEQHIGSDCVEEMDKHDFEDSIADDYDDAGYDELGDDYEDGEDVGEDSDADEIPEEESASAHEGSHNQELGKRGEEAACQYLLRRGFEIVERNWRCDSGEVDIIALEDDTLVFVEVKTRSSEAKGLPEEAVSRTKRKRYEAIALAYLRQSDLDTLTLRFDVISITLISHNKAFLRHHRDAFGKGD